MALAGGRRRAAAREAQRAERHALEDLHVVADDARLADDDARAVVDEERLADLGAGMDVDPREGVCVLRHDAGKHRDALAIELVRDPVDRDGLRSRDS
jgi:hypothetical protein